MKWQTIKLSRDRKSYSFDGEKVFEKEFIEALKFHAPGLAAVADESGSYHIDAYGKELYKERYSRSFGHYCNRAAVVLNEKSFHLTEKGTRAYKEDYVWCGNFQEDLCAVRDNESKYYHIDLEGYRTYKENYSYVGDYKDGIACVKKENGLYQHIDTDGNFVHSNEFLDLGIFHKNFATAKDENGWHHIDKNGAELYSQRYLIIEPFYNGHALVETFENKKIIIQESGGLVLEL